MAELTITTNKGDQASLSEATLAAFEAGLDGDILTAASPDYDQIRLIWNAMIDRRPGLIVRCKTASDVKRAVDLARENSLLLSVRGGGHNIAGNALCDGGLLIDLASMKSVRVDSETRRALVEPGALLADMDRETQVYGLATPLGINSTTGVAGLTLGGGFGWLTRRHGMTVDNLVSAQVVTADGRLVQASEQENPDLFWGIRGGGGNFGIVTRFEFALHPLGPEVFAGLMVFPLGQAQILLEKYAQYIETLPDELTVWVVLRKAPPLPFLPADVHGKEVLVLAIFYAGDPAEGEQLMGPLRGFGQTVGEHLGVMPYVDWQQAFDPLLTPGARNYWKSHNFAHLTSDGISAILEYVQTLPSDQCEIFLGLLGGQASRVATDATAYSHRDTLFVMNVHARWDEAAQDKECIDWARALFEATAPMAQGGVYVNFMTQEEVARVPAAYQPEVWERLVALKNKWDPANLFRMNQNIKPTA